jgi:hypothetical protein
MDTAGRSGVSLTLALVVVSWFAWVTFQTVHLTRERGNLDRVKANQEKPLQESTATRVQIDSFAAGIAKLAAQGNAGAQVIVVELQRRGITIDPNAKTIPPGSK